MAFFAFLRVGEIVLTKGNDSHSILGINDEQPAYHYNKVFQNRSIREGDNKSAKLLSLLHLPCEVYVKFFADSTKVVRSFLLSLWGKIFDKISVCCSFR